MKLRRSDLILCSILALVLIPASIKAQDFQRTYSIGAGGQIRVSNISGDVKVSGYGGNIVEVMAYKEGRDRDNIQVKDNSNGNRLDLGVQYLEKNRRTNASVNFVIRIPQSIQYVLEISSVSGDIHLTDVTGQAKADSVSGDVNVQNIAGIANAHTVSGDVNVEIRQLQGAGDMKFSSVSGDVLVTAPPDLDADVTMSCVSGSVKTDYPIQIHKQRYGPGQSASGQLGSGARSLRMSSVSGDISLYHKQR